MGPWANAIIAVSALLAATLSVFAFRGLVEAIELADNRCDTCHRAVAWPLPLRSHVCRRCRHEVRRLQHS